MTDAPADWTRTTLGALGVMSKGKGIKRSDVRASGVPCIRYGELYTEFQNYTATTRSFVDENVARTAQRIRKGDLLFAGSGETREEIGMCAAYVGDAPAVAGGDIIILRGDSFNPIYLGSLANSEAVASQKARAGQGDAVVHLYARGLSEVEVTLPSRAEQDAIANAIVDADDLIDTLERVIAKKQAIKQGMVQQLLTGKTRLPGFTEPWAKRTLGEVARIKTGARNNQDKTAGGRYPFFVRSATVERINSYSYDCEAILVPGEGGIGSIFHYIDGKFEVHQRVYKISDFAPDVRGRFIYHFMRQYFGAHAMENSVKATVDSLRLPTFKNFELQLPSLDEQQAIVDALDDAEAELMSLQGRLEKTRIIKTGMMQELLTGRTPLVAEECAA